MVRITSLGRWSRQLCGDTDVIVFCPIRSDFDYYYLPFALMRAVKPPFPLRGDE